MRNEATVLVKNEVVRAVEPTCQRALNELIEEDVMADSEGLPLDIDGM
jgi:hypothetical protein